MGPAAYIVKAMSRRFTIRAEALVWLLCAITAWFTVQPPSCEACERIAVAPHGSAAVHRNTPETPDACNGVCSCCVLQAVPVRMTAVVTFGIVHAVERSRPSEPVLFRHASVFRPPRQVLS